MSAALRRIPDRGQRVGEANGDWTTDGTLTIFRGETRCLHADIDKQNAS